MTTARPANPRSHSTVAPRSILVLKPSSLGDIVHTLPAVTLLRERWPDARIKWLANTEWLSILDDNPYIDQAVEFPRRKFSGVMGGVSFARWLLQMRESLAADLVLDFQGLFRTAVIGRAARRNIFSGLSDAREGARWLYDSATDTSGEKHAVERYLDLAESVTGLTRPSTLPFPLPQGAPPRHLQLPPHYIVFHPFSRGHGKSMDATTALSLAALLAETAPVLLVGRDAPALPASLPEGVITLINQTTLPELIWLMRNSSAVVSVDSGPMHIAAATAPTVLGIHSWSNPVKVGPYRPDALVWQSGTITPMHDILANRSFHPGKLPSLSDLHAIARAIARLLP